LAKARITIRDFLNFRRDDIITLPKRLNEEMPLLVGSRVKFTGVPGRSGRHRALRITQVVDPMDHLFHQ